MSTQKTYSSQKEIAEIWKLFRENELRIKETREQMKEADLQLKEQMKDTDRRMKETDRRMRELQTLFTSHWGKLMESLTKGGLLRALKERQIDVTGILPNPEKVYKNQRKEFDILAINGEEVVSVEVKTTLKVYHVKEFLETMKDFKNYFPEYKDKKIYGAVAFLKADDSAGVYAEKQGLFVLNPVSNVVKVINSPNFKPKLLA